MSEGGAANGPGDAKLRGVGKKKGYPQNCEGMRAVDEKKQISTQWPGTGIYDEHNAAPAPSLHRETPRAREPC